MQSSFDKDNELIAPENFAMVEPGFFRSAFPRTKNISFLKKLGLKTVISLVPEDYPDQMVEFYSSFGIQLFRRGLDGNKWPFKSIDEQTLRQVVFEVLNEANRPVLIHCNKGKHRTGTVVGCIRKARNWALSSIFNEYLLYASPKTRLEDQSLIESFQLYPIEQSSKPDIYSENSSDIINQSEEQLST